MTTTAGDRKPTSPTPTLETLAYWQGASEGRLMIGKCRACDQVHFYPRAHCPGCLSSDVALTEASGRGTLYSYSIMRRAAVPYVIAYVTLEEGPTMMSNLQGCAFEDIRIGMPLSVSFVESEDGQPVPIFVPAPASA